VSKSVQGWEAIEVNCRAGKASVRAVARKHGITEGSIKKRGKKEWMEGVAV